MIRATFYLVTLASFLGSCYVQKLTEKRLNRSKIMVTAQVVMKSKLGENPLDMYMDCINLEEFQASKKTVEMIQQYFEDNGFLVDEYLGVSFQISGCLTHFENFLGRQIEFKGSLRGKDGLSSPIDGHQIDGRLSPFVAAICLDDPYVYL